jgi:hypothetical protein
MLLNFTKLSGLKCNFEKTSIMRIGDTFSDYDKRIDGLGFSIVENCTLLGFNINGKGEFNAENYKLVDKKVNGILNFWRPFHLSITGKITVIKTLVLTPINYHATVLYPTDEWLKNTQSKIEKFVGGNLNIANHRIVKPVKEGGLGIFDISTFIGGLQCAWISRAANNTHDNWSHKLMSLKEKPLLQLNLNDTAPFGPVLGGIIHSFLLFREHFWEYGNNWSQESILNNKKFTLKKGEPNIFDDEFFETFMPELDYNLKNELNWNYLITDVYELLSRTELNNKLGFNVNFRAYVRLKSGLVNARKNFFKIQMPAGTSLEQFMSKIKKGSKLFRNILVHRELKGITTQIKTFAKLIEESVPLNNNAQVYNMQWNSAFYNIEARNFIFKFYNNTLGLTL